MKFAGCFLPLNKYFSPFFIYIRYVGSIVDRFRLRWNNYKCFQRVALEGGTPKQNYLHQHFLSEDHHGLLEDCKTTLIDKTDSSDPTGN